LANAAKVLPPGGPTSDELRVSEKEREELYKQIDRLKVENDRLKKRCYDTYSFAQEYDRPERR